MSTLKVEPTATEGNCVVLVVPERTTLMTGSVLSALIMLVVIEKTDMAMMQIMTAPSKGLRFMLSHLYANCAFWFSSKLRLVFLLAL